MAAKRGPKLKLLPPSTNLFALGGSSSTTNTSVSTSLSTIKTSTIKRENTSPTTSSAAPLLKKSKLQLSHHMTRSSGAIQLRRESGENWEESALEVDCVQLLDKVIEAEDLSDERVEMLLCGAVKQLRAQRAKPDSTLYLTLCYLAKTRPLLFCTEIVVEAFCSLLKRDSSLTFKAKSNNMVSILAANLLLAVYHDETSWPDTFVKVFIDDSLGERAWVDHEDCKGFVDNILASFNTKLPPKLMQQDVAVTKIGEAVVTAASSPNQTIAVTPTDTENIDEPLCSNVQMSNEMKEHLENISVTSRFTHNEEFVLQYVTEVINEQLNRRQPPSHDISRNMLKLLVSTSGIPAVRLIVAQKLDNWIQNPKLTRPAQDLLLAVCLNCNEYDKEVIGHLVKMRLKSKPLVNHFISCIKELLNQCDGTFRLVLRTVIYNELSPTKNLNNLQLISIMFQHSSEKATKVLGEVFQEMLISKDDFLRAMRTLLREIVRVLRYEHINFFQFALCLIEDSSIFSDIDSVDVAIRERAVLSITDLLTMIIFLSLTPSVREAISTSKSDRREIIRNYQMQIANIQRIAVEWLQTTVLKSFQPERINYLHCLNKILFVESQENYCNKDNWPPETERNFVLRMSSEVPLLEDTLTRLLAMGTSKDNPLTSAETIELSDAIIKRAAAISDGDLVTYPVLHIINKEVFTLLMKNAIYRHPENITLPAGYEAPNMAISDLYWKVWIQLLILTAHNPTEFGTLAWESYPTLGILIEMTITNHFQFPPPTKISDDLINRELQISGYEKQQILQFESYLAAASTKVQINESNSLLLSKLITMDPLGPARKPPQSVLEQFKTFSVHLRLGHLLCQSRNPDFLLEIIQRQQKQIGLHHTSSSPMPWLVELVESNENNFGMLPVQCLCEFLLGQISEEESAPLMSAETNKAEKSKKKEKRRKQIKLITHLQNVIANQVTYSKELIEYFMKRLSFQQSSARILASKALSLVLCCDTSLPYESAIVYSDVKTWLLEKLPLSSNFEFIKASCCKALRLAILVETVPNLVCHYIQYLSLYDDSPDISELALNCAHILIDRQIITNCILQQTNLKNTFLESLTKIFLSHLSVVRKPAMQIYSWANAQDHILVQWKEEEAAILNISVVHGMIILLTFGPSDANQMTYEQLLDAWFCEPQPQAYLVDTSEEALLIPDWLRLKLLRSTSPKLLDAALKDIEPSQLILFIQSFGVPITSMQKILEALDLAIEVEAYAVRDAVTDESLILRFVEVQWMRGVTSGHSFAKFLDYKAEEFKGKEEDITMISEADDSFVDNKTLIEYNIFKEDFQKYLNGESNGTQFLIQLYRDINKELLDKNISNKKITKLLLSEIVRTIDQCVDVLNKGDLNSIFNLIVTFSVMDSKLLGLDFELLLLKKTIKECVEIKNCIVKNVFERIVDKKSKPKTDRLVSSSKKTPIKTIEELAKLIMKKDKELHANKGLLLEKFHKLEPELVKEHSSVSSSEIQLLFSRNCPYLLSLLIHKTRFTTLATCIRIVLSDDKLGNLNSTAVLEFLTACLGSPRIWIGRDLNQPKHMIHEDVLNLNDNQILKLIDYIIDEGDVAKRIALIIKICCLNKNRIKLIVDDLKRRENNNDSQSLIAREMLFRLYLQIPSIEQPLKIVEQDLIISSSEPSVIDSVTHNLLTAFTCIDNANNRNQYLNDCELSMLKLASKHPILFLRHLPLIPSLLNSKINSVNYHVFRNRNYLLTFKRLLNIVRLLKPHLWSKYVKGLNELLDTYLLLFMCYYQFAGKEILQMLSQYLFLIDEWIKYDSDSAKLWLKGNRKQFLELSSAYPEQSLFKSLLSGLPFQQQSQSSMQQQLQQNILLRLRESKSNGNSINIVLNDLDKISETKPDILEYFVDDLHQLYFNTFAREMAFKLTIKLLNYNPNLSKLFVPTYCQCLQREDFNLANIALEYLPEFVIIAQEDRLMILKKAFEIGIMGNTNVLNSVCDTFALLNQQMGF